MERFYPVLSKAAEGPCNPLFFKPDDHSKHMEHMEVTDKIIFRAYGVAPSSGSRYENVY